MSALYTIIGLVIARPETRERVHDILTAFVAPTRAEPGCVNYDFHVDPDEPCVFMFYENWRSKADLDAHLNMPHLRPLVDHANDLLARPVEIKHYKMLSTLVPPRS